MHEADEEILAKLEAAKEEFTAREEKVARDKAAQNEPPKEKATQDECM